MLGYYKGLRKDIEIEDYITYFRDILLIDTFYSIHIGRVDVERNRD